ncbi:DUF3502 domain-containing protein [Paenibacillus psychroresistens]|nr:DUF3502 domain-containing protein [Paenibacillus psychroresistens]
MRKRLVGLRISVLLILVLSIVLAGCANTNKKEAASPAVSDDKTSSSSTPAENTPPPSADISEFVELIWYMPPPLDPRPNEANVMKAVNEVLKEKINAHVTIKFVDWATYVQKIKVAASAGEEFDLFSDLLGTLGFSQNVSSGIAMELDDLINKYGQDIVKKVPNQAWQAVTSQGKKYGIANPSAWVNSFNIAMRKDIADKYAIDYASIHSYKDLEPVLESLKNKEPDMIPFVGYGPGYAAFQQTFDKISPMIGYDVVDGKWKSQLEEQTWIDLVKMMHDWAQKGYIPKKVITDANAEFKTGRYAVASYHIYDPSFVKTSTDFGVPMVATPLDFHNVVTGSSIRTAVSYVSTTSKHPERAMMLLNLIYSDKEFFNKFAYGVEGEDWNYVSGKGTDNPIIKTSEKTNWAMWHPWIGSLWDQWPSNWNSKEVLDGLKATIDKAEYSPYAGFTFDSTPVKKEMAQIDAIFPELTPVFLAGDVDASIAKLKEKVDKAGLSEVLKEIQKQVDAWKATNS